MTFDAVEDPFAHLHDEDYHARYNAPVLGHEGLIYSSGPPVLSLDGEWLCTIHPFD